MPYVHVDVDLDEFDTSELVEEVCNRLKMIGKRKSPTEEQKNELIALVKELGEGLNIVGDGQIDIKSLEDELKMDHIKSVFHNYTLSQILNLLP